MVEQRCRVGSDKKTVKDDQESGREWGEKKLMFEPCEMQNIAPEGQPGGGSDQDEVINLLSWVNGWGHHSKTSKVAT